MRRPSIFVTVLAASALVIGSGLVIGKLAWSAPEVPSTLSRAVKGQTIVSPALPAARFTIAQGLSFRSGQRFLLGRGTDAEQYLFVDAASGGGVRRLLWIQFEHKLPGNSDSYNYPPEHTADLGGLSFVHDTKLYADYAGVKPAPNSDVEKARAQLAAHGLFLPHAASRIRLFHLPEPDNRSELMIIYMEALDRLPEGAGADIPQDGMPADGPFPALAQTMLANLRGAVTITR